MTRLGSSEHYGRAEQAQQQHQQCHQRRAPGCPAAEPPKTPQNPPCAAPGACCFCAGPGPRAKAPSLEDGRSFPQRPRWPRAPFQQRPEEPGTKGSAHGPPGTPREQPPTCPTQPLTAAVSRSAPETVTASARRGTDMLLPHIHRDRLRHWHLRDGGAEVRRGNTPPSCRGHPGTAPPCPEPPNAPRAAAPGSRGGWAGRIRRRRER